MYKATNLVWQRFDSLHLICLTRLLSRWRNSPHLCMNCSELYHQDMPAPSLYPIIQLSNYGQQSNHCVSISPKTFPKKQDHFSHSNTLFSVKKRQLFRFFHIILQFTKAHLHCTPVSTHPTHPPQPTTLGPWASKPHPFQGRFQSSHFTHRKGGSPRFPPPTMCWTSGRLEAATGPPIGAINPYKWPYTWVTRVISPL